MQEVLTVNSLNELVVDFYDSQKIADWVEEYPTVVNWLKTTLGQPFSGWQPYAPWAYDEKGLDSEYILDDKVKMYLPNGNFLVPTLPRGNADLPQYRYAFPLRTVGTRR
jgi:hypothetical protein